VSHVWPPLSTRQKTKFWNRQQPGGIFIQKNWLNIFSRTDFALIFALLSTENAEGKANRREFSSAGSEHLPYKQRVGGSNPSTPTTSPR
jgi:hypothetical protein